MADDKEIIRESLKLHLNLAQEMGVGEIPLVAEANGSCRLQVSRSSSAERVANRRGPPTSPERTGGERGLLGEEGKTGPAPPAARSGALLPASPVPADFISVSFPRLNPIGQIMGTYLVCETDGKLVLVDQHAAHERILFDRLLEQFKAGNIPSQPLLIPENFDLTPSDAEMLKKYLKDMEQFGLEIDFFGGSTFIVRSVPVLFKKKGSIRDLVLDITGEAIEQGKVTALAENLNGALATLACHSAVRANHNLEIPEIRALLADLEKYSLTSFCPHGRPVAVEIGKGELERWFKRKV